MNVTSEGATQLRASWVHAPGGRDGYRVTLYQAGVPVHSSPVGAQVDGASFSALTPGTEYKVEVVTQAGPFRAVAASVAGWTSEWAWGWGGEGRWEGLPGAPPPGAPPPVPRLACGLGPRVGSDVACSPPTAPAVPAELLVSMQAGSAVVSLAWASGPLGHGACHTQLAGAGLLSRERLLSREQPLALGQARLVLRDLTPGRNLSLTVRCQAGPLQASTHPVLLPVGTLESVGGWGTLSTKPSRPAPSRAVGALPSRPEPPLALQMGGGRGASGGARFSLWPLFLSAVKVPSASEPLHLCTDPHSIRNS